MFFIVFLSKYIPIAGGENPDYKIHLPYENLNDIIKVLQDAVDNKDK